MVRRPRKKDEQTVLKKLFIANEEMRGLISFTLLNYKMEINYRFYKYRNFLEININKVLISS